jgi:NAD(P)-dependent dehydrogenase (short-subunit alcohol dehydrogenase family)
MNIHIDTTTLSSNLSPTRQIPRSNSHARTKQNMTKPIAFIIGAGKNIGASTAKALRSQGYRIALAARSLKPEDSTSETLHLTLDLSKPESVGPAFASLRKKWGEPSVVFYNG